MKKSLLLFSLLAAVPAAALPLMEPATASSVVMKDRPVRLPPLFWYERDREADTHLFMAALLYWDVKDGDAGQKLFFPIFYEWREGGRSFFLSLPMILSYHRPGGHWLLAGPFYRGSDEEITRTACFPVYWQSIRREGGRVTVALPFLFYDYRSHDRRNIDTVFPVGFLRKRGDMNMGLLGPYFWETDPESRFRVLFPLYWHGRAPDTRFDVFVPFYHVWASDPVVLSTAAPTGRHWAGLFPLVGAAWGRDFRSNHLLPLYYFSRDGDRRSFVTIPYSSFRESDGRSGHVGLYYYNHDPDLTVNGVFPFWMRRCSTDGFESKTQVLNFYYSRENEDVFHTFFPFYGYWRTPEGSRTLSWGYWRSSDRDGSTGWCLLYLWKEGENGDQNRIFFPLYWRFKRAPDWQVDVLFPFYTRYRDGNTVVTAVPPFVWSRSPGHRTYSLFFLYWHDREGDRSVTALAPLFLTQSNPERKSLFSPILWTRRSHLSREGIFPPVYWYRSAEARRTFVVPFFWDVRTDSTDLRVLTLAYRWRRGNTTEIGFFPLWGTRSALVKKDGVFRREPRGGYLLPFYWSEIDGKGNGMWVIPPILGFVSRSGVGTEREQFSMNYLLFGSVRKSKDHLEHGFFPLYQFNRDKKDVNWWAPRIIALAAYDRKGDRSRGAAVLWFWWRDPAVDRDIVLPLFYRSRKYDVSVSTEAGVRRGERVAGTTVFFPVWWSGTDGAHSYLYLPPFYAQDRNGVSRWRLVAPLWVSYDGEQERKLRILFPLYWRFSSARRPPSSAAEEKKDVVVVGPYYQVDSWRQGLRTHTVGVAPFFSRTYTGPGDKYFEVLGGLFGRDVQAGRRRFRFLWFLYTSPKSIAVQLSRHTGGSRYPVRETVS